MVSIITVAPVFDITIRANLFDDYGFFWLAKGQNKEYLIAGWQVKGILEFLSLY